MKPVLIICYLLCALVTQGQSVEITARASAETVPLDQPFKLIYTLNTDGQFNAPSMNGLKLLSGPSKSSFSSIEIINGKYSQKTSVTYTLIVRGKKEGTITIPPASVVIDGKSYKSNSITVTITAGGSPVTNDQPEGTRSENRYAFTQIQLSKSKVFEGEPVLAVYKLYTIFDRNSPDDLKFGAQPGCWIQEIKGGKNGWPATQQIINGRRYNVFILRKDILIPQRAGSIKLEAFDLSMVSQVNFFESRRFDMVSNAPVLEVKPLPSPRPNGFTGAVGKYSLSSRISSDTVKENDAIDLTVTLEGSGNLKLVEGLKPEWPADFEIYDPEVSENIRVSESGMSGKKEFKHLVIPRHAGIFHIAETPFVYFDIEKGQYVHLRLPAYDIKVLRGDGKDVSGVTTLQNKENVETLHKDIRFLKVVDSDELQSDSFTGTGTYYVMLAGLPLLLLSIAFLVKTRNEHHVQVARRNRKISKEIQALLQSAEKETGNTGDQFYEFAGKALQLQLLERTGIKITELGKEEMKSALIQRGLLDDQAAQACELFNTYEMARYANISASDRKTLYARTETLIQELNRL